MPSRPRLTVLAATAVLALAACGGSGSDAETDAGAAPSASAEADPGVVVALDDFAAITVMALGVTPDLAFDTFGYTSTAAIFEEAGVTPQPYGQELDIEKVVAADPDVIVGVSLPTTVAQQATLEKLGTTAILEYTADWKTALRGAAKALGREDRAAAIEQRIDASIADLKADLAEAGQAGKPVSVIAGSADDAFSPPVKTNLGGLLAAVGLDRPAPQQAEVQAAAPFVTISAETLTANDGTALYLLKGKTYPIDKIKASPLYPRLKAVQDGRAHEVSGEMWFGSNPVSIQWVLDDLRATLLENGEPLEESKAGARLKETVALGTS